MKTWKGGKDQNEVADYVVEWAPRLADPADPETIDVIDTSTWIPPDGIDVIANSHDDDTTTVWLSGGTDGEEYVLVNRITTEGGRTFDQSCKIKVKTK